MENLDPPPLPPQIKDGAASSLIWGDGGLLFHFILSKIVVRVLYPVHIFQSAFYT